MYLPIQRLVGGVHTECEQQVTSSYLHCTAVKKNTTSSWTNGTSTVEILPDWTSAIRDLTSLKVNYAVSFEQTRSHTSGCPQVLLIGDASFGLNG